MPFLLPLVSLLLSSTTSTSVPSTKEHYCLDDAPINSNYQRLGNLFCFQDHLDNNDSDFVSPLLLPGQMAPILWRDSSKMATQYAFQIGLPTNLTVALLHYCHSLGLTDLLRNLTAQPIPALDGDRHNGKFVTLGENRWYAQRPASKWRSNMHWISPADEKTHEEYLRVLMERGQFGDVLDAIGQALNRTGLVAYHLSVIGVSYSEEGYVHHDTLDTNGGVYNLIVPLLLEDSVPPELILLDDGESSRRGGFKYRVGTGVMMGDAAYHGTLECDYREMQHAKHGAYNVTTGKRSGMRMAATIYIADIDEKNVEQVASQTLTQIFPLADTKWLMSQAQRHWKQPKDGNETSTAILHSRPDVGRKAFRFRDELDDCVDRSQRGMCESDETETRKKCVRSCKVYIEEGPILVEKIEETKVNLCVQNRTGGRECHVYHDNMSIAGDFVSPSLEPGEIFPIVWRDKEVSFANKYAFQIGIPRELITELLNYCHTLGITDLMRDLVGGNPIEAQEEHTGKFFSLSDGNRWYAQRPAKKWTSNMHWVSPADEKTHEEYLRVLARGNFDLILDAIGRYLGLEGLVAYHLTFIGVSFSEKGFIHHDSTKSGASVYNVIIPLIVEDNASPELILLDDVSDDRVGVLKYRIGVGAMMGDDAMHGTEACDYRATKGIRLAATVYIADINAENAKDIATRTLTQIFPLPDTRWLLSQAGRHWSSLNENTLMNDKGRKDFVFHDKLMNCADRAEKGMCESDTSFTRVKCLRSCHIYDERLNSNNTELEKVVGSDMEHLINTFFYNLEDNGTCIDENDDCSEKASRGLCMTDPDGMKKNGCNWSCLYCFTLESNDLFSLGENQLLEKVEDEVSEEDHPSPEDVSEIILKTQEYFVNEVFVMEEYAHVRLSCRNYYMECSIWAAQGHCETNHGWMGKNCAAACRNCLMVDWNVRCPVDYDSNIFKPGDIDAMFKRWLNEAGQDISSFSRENLPIGGTHPFGELVVITSPYDDMMPILRKEDKEFAHLYTPLPWVVAIENFLSEEECNRLIELGGDSYERSTEYAGEMNIDGTYDFVESEGRTSMNTWCQNECRDDPIAKGVLERMVQLTGIPYENYEDIQLVRYEPGQFYQKHHDYSSSHEGTQYGPRILTFFLYLNNVEDGGGTQFEELGFAAQPKRGMALIWPSVTNEDPEVMDDWTWHEALPVISGIKFGANAWIHLRNYQSTPDYC